MRPVFSLPRLAASIGLVLAVTLLYRALVPVNPTTVALSYMVAILFVASRWAVVESTAAALAATVCLNIFFLPPVGRVTIADPQNWIALAAFLIAGIVASQLSGRARSRHLDALARQRDLERLYALSRGLLQSPGHPSVPAAIASHISEAFGFQKVGVFDCGTDTVSWVGRGEVSSLDTQLRDVARQSGSLHEGGMQLVAVHLGGVVIGSLAVPDTGLSATVLRSITNLAAIGLERARSLEAAARAEIARQSGELRATMLDALAHEFKTPLTSMKVAACDLLASLSDERHRELAAIVDEDLERLQSLVTDTVQIVRVDSGDFTLRPNDYSLLELVETTVRQFHARLDGRTLTTRVPKSASIRADRDLLGLALRQLLDNAVKYSPVTSAIEITAVAAGGETLDISVTNSGPPIPDRDRDRLFDRFYRGSQARRVPGTGMGLAIVRQIIEAHRGRLSMSSSVGEGTRFTMSLPKGGDTL